MRFKAIFLKLSFSLVLNKVMAQEKSKDFSNSDLKELQEKYMEAFPHAREFFKFDNSSRSDSNRKPAPPKLAEGTCMRETFFSEMGRANRVMVYAEMAYKNSTIEGGCHDLRKLNKTVKSVETYGKSVRLFYAASCGGWSLAVYPGREGFHKVLDQKLTEVESVGPCLAYEFQSSSLKPNSIIVQKNISDSVNHIPDLVEFYSHSKQNNFKRFVVSDGSVTHYVLGPQNRTQFIRAGIYAKHLNASQPKTEMKNDTNCNSSNNHDTMNCYGIPVSLGGPANKNYNVIPASCKGSQKWAEVISGTSPPKGKSWIVMSLNFAYENDEQTKPLAFYYLINNNNKDIKYGRVQM